MIEKRFVDYFDKDHNYIIQDLQNEDEYQVGFVNCDEDVFLELINQLSDENEQLKQELKTKCIVNKQYEENQRLIKMLDNVANYMQKQYKDMSIDDFVEWWNKMATEGLEND